MADRQTTTTSDSVQTALSDAIYEGLCDEITGGKLRPGETLSRRDIARRYGTSSIPVIEALVRLESTGLIEAEARQSARVRKISVETIQEDYVLREAYETQAIRLSCETAIDAEIEELYALAEAVDTSATAVRKRRTPGTKGPLLHWQFHRAIARISRCPALVRELERIELLRRLQANWYFTPNLPDLPRYHSQLVDAIQARDPERADSQMRAHVRSGLDKELMAYRLKASS